MTASDTGLNTPPFGPATPVPDSTVTSYSAADFPAPAGVPPLSSAPAPARPRRRWGTMVAAASLSAVIGAGAGIGSYAYLDQSSTALSPITVTTASAPQSPAPAGSIAAAADVIDDSVVTITVESGRSGDIGSGMVLDQAGHILTNNHVVEAAAQGGTITVTFHNGTTAQAALTGRSETNDLAVIKVDGASDLVPVTFAKSDSIEVGQSVLAAGAPLGLSESVTSGIVSNTARPVRSGSNDDAVYLAVQTDAAINPGNSGGPLIDLNGSVIGVNSSIAGTGSSADGSQSGNIGIGFAIPADVAVRVAGELIDHGSSTNASLGVRVGGTDSELSTGTGVTLGTVVDGGAAAQAGLRAGDVVTRINDFPITTPDGLIAATRFYAPGTKIDVTYSRDGDAAQTVSVTLGSS